jgi:hypothetical protein
MYRDRCFAATCRLLLGSCPPGGYLSYSRDVEAVCFPGHDSRVMTLPKIALSSLASLACIFISTLAFSEPCPKVNTTTQTPATMRAIVKAVNCLVASGAAPAPAAFRTADVRFAEARTGTQVDTLPIVGPQHSHTYPGFVLAILSMPVDNIHKSAIVTPDSPQAIVSGAGGGECKLKLNSDRTIDAQCNQAGGTVFVVFK